MGILQTIGAAITGEPEQWDTAAVRARLPLPLWFIGDRIEGWRANLFRPREEAGIHWLLLPAINRDDAAAQADLYFAGQHPDQLALERIFELYRRGLIDVQLFTWPVPVDANHF